MSVDDLHGRANWPDDTDEKQPPDLADQERLCSGCEQLLPLERFGRIRDGYFRKCKRCNRPALWGKPPHLVGFLRDYTPAEKRERRKANLRHMNAVYARYNKRKEAS